MHGWVGIRENINTIQIRKKKMNKQESNFNKKKIIIGLIGSNWTGHHNKKEKACNSPDPLRVDIVVLFGLLHWRSIRT